MMSFLKNSFLSLACLAAFSAWGANNAITPVAFVGNPPPEVDGSMERMAQLAGSIKFNSAQQLYYGKKCMAGCKKPLRNSGHRL